MDLQGFWSCLNFLGLQKSLMQSLRKILFQTSSIYTKLYNTDHKKLLMHAVERTATNVNIVETAVLDVPPTGL